MLKAGNFSINSSVNESGKFKSDKNKISKRDTRFGRRFLYSASLASIQTTRTGESTNKILLDYYKNSLNGKKKTAALVAIMHTVVKPIAIFYIVRTLKNVFFMQFL